jgi:C1A family cysteine protease
MKKIIICILVGLLFIYTITPITNSIRINNNLENPYTIESWKCIENQETIIESDNKNIFEPYVMESQSIKQIRNIDPDIISPKPNIANVPDEFSWKNYQGQDWTSSIKRQECGDCWLFAAIGALECRINIKEGWADLDPDLSEQYVLSCMPKAGTCKGGWDYKAYKYIMETSSDGNYHNGALLENCFYYVGIDSRGCDYYDCDHEPVTCSEKCDNWENYLVPIDGFDRWFPDFGDIQDINRIKTSIYQNGPVSAIFLADDDFSEWVSKHHDPNEYYPYKGRVTEHNHIVVLVGWRDNPSIGRGGYWIVKNSWGPNSGYEGFFNIEYGSLGIDSIQICEVDYNPISYNWNPKANCGGLYHGNVGDYITFDASKSKDPEGEIISYEWDFGDGTTGNGVTVSHKYSKRGIYQVTLKVTDEFGKTGIEETNALVDFWQTGDYWTYNVDINLELDGLVSGDFNFDLHDFIFSVDEITANDYILHYQGGMNGEFTSTINDFSFEGKTKKSIPINGDIVINKKTLGIKELSINMKGRISIGRNPQQIFRFPVPLDLKTNIIFEEEFELINLPLKDYKTLDIQSKDIIVDGELKSIWLNILNIINKISGQLLIPPEIGALLPIIDLSDLLETMGLEDLQLQGHPFSCKYAGDLSVEAGTYESYNIQVQSAYFDTYLINYYFAPDVYNIILLEADFNDHYGMLGVINGNINAELISTDYT